MEYTFKIPNGININDFINNTYLCMTITSVKGDQPNFTEQNLKDMFEVSIINTDDNNNINLKDYEAKKKKIINEYSQKFDNLENRNMNRYTFAKKHMKLKSDRDEKIDELKTKYNIILENIDNKNI